jgi:outer membrane protein assembly factor BamB
MNMLFRSSRLHRVGLALLLSLSGATLATAGDWPQWRGPNHDDVSTETGLLKEWPAGGPALAWKAKDIGAGYSGVTVAAGRIYTAGDKGDSSYVVALKEADGTPIWSAKLGKSGPVGKPEFEGPRSTPTVDGNLVFALGQRGELVCLEATQGKEVWRKALVGDLSGVCPNWGYAESPLVDADKLVLTPGGSPGTVVALNKKTGEVLWRTREFTDAPHYSSLAVAELGGVHQYIVLTPEHVAGIDAANGNVLWRVDRKGKTAVIPSPIYSDGFVYVSSAYGVGCNLFKVAAVAGGYKAEEVYANKVLGNKHGGVVKVGNYLYGHADDKGWTCQDFKSGEAKWAERQKLGKGAIAYADGRLYLRQEDGKGTVVLLEPSAEGWKEHGRFEPPERSAKNSWPHPVIANGKLYLRDQEVLLCYDVKK